MAVSDLITIKWNFFQSREQMRSAWSQEKRILEENSNRFIFCPIFLYLYILVASWLTEPNICILYNSNEVRDRMIGLKYRAGRTPWDLLYILRYRRLITETVESWDIAASNLEHCEVTAYLSCKAMKCFAAPQGRQSVAAILRNRKSYQTWRRVISSWIKA